MLLADYQLRSPTLTDLDRCYAIERSAYPGDEAASREKIEKRIRMYPDGFMLLEIDGEIAGMINSACADKVMMADSAVKELEGHDPAGKQAVVLSLAVHPDYQGQGLAGLLLVNFIQRMKRLHKQSIELMCREEHIALYRRFGFSYVRPSASAHGGLAWHEMLLRL